ncbi:MAG: tetratricopeptide repeat protein [Thermoanaerobaculia bacterium]
MAQPASSPKIDELRSRLRTEPNSRMFYPLAEELRKAGQHEEAEQVLRGGLANHQAYLAAWVSLGRVLREQKRDADAIDPLLRAMQIDPANVVAARLLGDCYLEVGEKLEAIKKYKLVQALMPGDEELATVVESLDRDLNPPESLFEEPAPFASQDSSAEAPSPDPDDEPAVALGDAEVGAPVESPFAAPDEEEAGAFGESLPLEPSVESMAQGQQIEAATGDAEPMLASHELSPFEEPVPDYSAAALEIEAPPGVHIGTAPVESEVPPPVVEEEPLPAIESAPSPPSIDFEPQAPSLFEEAAVATGVSAAETSTPDLAYAGQVEEESGGQDEADVFAPAAEPFDEGDGRASHPPEDLSSTITMADLYVRQGLVDYARQIYESLLMRDPGNEAVRARLESLSRPAVSAPLSPEQKIARLQEWLAKVTRKEVGRV